MITSTNVRAPELDVSEWVGSPTTLADLRGRVVMLEAFQMLCPGCITRGLPQAQRVQRELPDVAVIGVHTVFENHAAMKPDALRVFLNEFGYTFPVAVDRHDGRDTPVTMRAYQLRGTPSTILIDKAGRLRLAHFGALDDLALGTFLGRLLAEPSDPV